MRVEEDELAWRERRCVRPGFDDAAQCYFAGDERRGERVGPFAAVDFAGVGDDKGGEDADYGAAWPCARGWNGFDCERLVGAGEFEYSVRLGDGGGGHDCRI